MAGWDCPECGRRFRRAGQSHECAPAMDLEEYFATGPPHERPVCEAVIAHLSTLGPLHVEPVSVGIFLKRAGGFAQLRPMERWVAVSFALPRRATHPTIVRKVVPYSGRYHHVANVRSPDDLDDALRDLLTESYLAAPD
jgi:hypothetical protein